MHIHVFTNSPGAPHLSDGRFPVMLSTDSASRKSSLTRSERCALRIIFSTEIDVMVFPTLKFFAVLSTCISTFALLPALLPCKGQARRAQKAHEQSERLSLRLDLLVLPQLIVRFDVVLERVGGRRHCQPGRHQDMLGTEPSSVAQSGGQQEVALEAQLPVEKEYLGIGKNMKRSFIFA